MSRVGVFVYTYGAGSQPNRKIVFQRQGQNQETISAKVYAYVNGKKQVISSLSGNQILVEGASQSEKLRAIENYRESRIKPSFEPEHPISDLPVDRQDAIISQLIPKGPWHITVQNHVGDDPRFEKVVRLTLFDGS